MNTPNTVQEHIEGEHRATQTMLPELSALYQSIERRKAEMLARLEALSAEEQGRQANPAAWSPLQMMDHVVIVEEWMAGRNVAALPANARVLLKGRLFITLGGGLMRSGLRTPTLPMAAPRGALDFPAIPFPAIRQRWDDARTRLRPMLAAVTPQTRPLPIALHPAAGPLNAQQVLLLLDAHLIYHARHFPRTH